MGILFEVGKIAPPPFWPYRGGDGAILHQDSTGAVFVPIYLNSPMETELNELAQPIAARYFARDDGCALWFLGFGSRPFIFDLPHDPTKYPREQWESRLAAWERNNLWHFIVVDSASGKIATSIRVAIAPEDFYAKSQKQQKRRWRRQISKSLMTNLSITTARRI
jgi:hypothetical protein